MDILCKVYNKAKDNHSSVDALEFYITSKGEFKIYLIEFKNVNLELDSEIDLLDNLLSKIIEDTPKYRKYISTVNYLNTHSHLFSSSFNIKINNFYNDYMDFNWQDYKKYISTLNFLKNFLNDEMFLDLKLKPLETLYCIIPNLINKNIENENLKKELLKHLLFNCECNYIFVSNVYDNTIIKSKSKRRLHLKRSFSSLYRLKNNAFNNVANLNPDQFNDLIKKILKSKAYEKKRKIRNLFFALERHPIFNSMEDY